MKKIHLIGNAHLDPVWLWNWQEGFAEIKATFRSALDRMKEFEDYKFTSACSLYYMWIEKSDKKMFAEIVQRVKEGRWCIVGGWYIQPDCNLPCGEAFARHALVSQRYFKEKFGKIAKCGYNVDSFGHNGSIPKLMRNSGMENYVFMRPMPHEKELPQNLFLWESMDGSRVTAYRLPHFYNIDSSRFEEFYKIVSPEENYDIMAFYGVGNHGGGPTVELMDKMKRELGEEYVYSTPNEYFESVKGVDLPIVKDDLQFHAKGCYIACSQIKEGNRNSENAILETEIYSVISNHLIGTEYPEEEILRAWKNIMFNQFHDILGGCSIREAYKDAGYMHSEAMAIAQRNTNFALQQISWNIDTMDGKELKAYKQAGSPIVSWRCEENIGTPIVVFNSLANAVKACVTVKDVPEYVTDRDGNVVPMQIVRDSKTDGENKYCVAFAAEVPAMGYTVYRMYFKDKKETEDKSSFICTDNSLENEFIRLAFNEKSGELKSIFDKKNKKELLSGETQTLFADETKCDTWAHDIKEFKDVVGVFEKGSVRLTESGPVRATVRSEMKLFNTKIIRDYTLEAHSNVVKVSARIDFHEKHKMLKFSVPVNAETCKAYAEIPFGYIERPTDGTEQCCGKWIAMHHAVGGIGMSNTSKYSFDADKNVLSLTILRGALYADHFGHRDEFCEFMEQGEHKFEYSIFPFESFSDCEIKAEELNNKPTVVVETFHKGALPTEFSAISVSEKNIITTALKQGEDGGLVLRCYEAENIDTDVRINILGTEIKTHFSHNEVKTFLMKDEKITETDFMEWEAAQ